jgi:hypothetical protein
MLKSPKTWLAVGLLTLFTSCLGPNHATGHLFKWNGGIENRWGRSVVFILVFPAYVVTSIGDVLIFNSIQWWSGDNPISDPNADIGAFVVVGDDVEASVEVNEEDSQ